MLRFFSLHIKVIQKLESIVIKELNTHFVYSHKRVHKMESTDTSPNGSRKHTTLRKAGIRTIVSVRWRPKTSQYAGIKR